MTIRLRILVFAGVLASQPAAQTAAAELDPAKLKLASANVLVVDADTGRPVYAKSAHEVTPIASLTKLMTAIVVLEGGQGQDEMLDVDVGDFDYVKGSRSRLGMGVELSRGEMLRLALMASENRAASALARHYPGGSDAFVAAMNDKAQDLGMTRTHFDDATGLSPTNVSTAHDLALLVSAAAQYPLIREYSTTPSHYVELPPSGRIVGFNNSNRLVLNADWEIRLQKTGYIREAGRCVVMLATIASKPFVIVLLDSVGRYTRLGDAQRIKHWLETGQTRVLPRAHAVPARPVAKGRIKGTVNPVPRSEAAAKPRKISG